MSSLTVITGNRGKAAEIGAILGMVVEHQALDITEIQSLDVEEVARDKAARAFEMIGKPVIVDDTGMSVQALGGMPGALIAWFLDNIGPDGILKLLDGSTDRRASVSTAIGYADNRGVHVFIGTVQGSIPDEPRGTNGFGYDPIFIPEGQEQTYAEMTSEQKNLGSMRAIALAKLADFLQNSNSQ